MSQFLLTENFYDFKNNKIIIDKNYNDFHHLVDVFRIKENETIKFLLILENDNTKTLLTKCKTIKNNYLEFIIEKIINNIKPNLELNLYQCVPSFDKLEKIIEKAVELNISNIFLVLSKNVSVNKKIFLSKFDRLNRIIISSVKQSEAKFITKIQKPLNILDLKINYKNNFNVVAYENAENSFTKNLKLMIQSFLKQNIDGKLIFNILIGSEGGLDIDEIKYLRMCNWNDLKLSGNILRVETAFVAITSILKYEIGI